jgi:proteasome lid subunit RPN8/RPN11
MPEEACGLIGGMNGSAREIYPVTNILHSSVRYKMAPQEQWAVFQQMEQSGYQLLAIYHSHPTGPDYPSPTDIAEAYYPDTVYMICYILDSKWCCKGYRIEDGSVKETPIRILDYQDQET